MRWQYRYNTSNPGLPQVLHSQTQTDSNIAFWIDYPHASNSSQTVERDDYHCGAPGKPHCIIFTSVLAQYLTFQASHGLDPRKQYANESIHDTSSPRNTLVSGLWGEIFAISRTREGDKILPQPLLKFLASQASHGLAARKKSVDQRILESQFTSASLVHDLR